MFSIMVRFHAVRLPQILPFGPVVLWAKLFHAWRRFYLYARADVPVLVVTLALFCCLIAPQTAAAQEEANPVLLLKGPDRSTPKAWITSFISEATKLDTLLRAYGAERTRANLQAYSSQLELLRRFFDLDTVPIAFRTTVGNEAAVQMIDVLNRLPPDQIFDAEGLNSATGANDDVWTLPGTDIVLVRRKDGADARNYVMPRDMIAELPNLREKVMQFPVLREPAFRDMQSAQANLTGPLFPRALVTALSGWLDAPLLGVPSWKLLVSFLAVLATIAVNVAVYRLVKAVAKRSSTDSAAWLKGLSPLTLAASFAALAIFCQTQLILQGSAAILVVSLRSMCLIVSAAWAILSLADIVTETLIDYERGPDKEMDAELTRLIGKTSGVVGAIAVFFVGLGTLGVPTAGILTSLGVGGVGIAFAARVTMENLFGGLLLLTDRPFRIGDHIKIKQGEGIVTDIGVRSCRIATIDGNILTIPNGALSASAVTKVQDRDTFPPRERSV